MTYPKRGLAAFAKPVRMEGARNRRLLVVVPFGGRMPIRVVIADDHPLTREGLRQYIELEDDIEVAGEAASGTDLLVTLDELDPKPDIAIVDARMPGADVAETARAIARRHPTVRVVVLSAFDDSQMVLAAVRAGAGGYLLKSRDAEHIIRALRLVHAGNLVIDPEATPAILRGVTGAEATTDVEPLSDRELQVLRLLAAGCTNRDIANRLTLSSETVKGYVERILKKLRASDRTAAVAEGLRRGLIE